MLVHPQFDPIAIDLHRFGIPLGIHWYGITYLVAFALFMGLARIRAARSPYVEAGWTPRDIEDLLFYGVLGVILGGRLGFVLFYKAGYYAANPLEIFAVWEGGMSFHGGLLGVLAAVYFFARVRGRAFFEITDLIAPCVPLGLAAGRIGNFINGELWGRFADASLPWAMVFPQSGSMQPRHPSQLYQFAMEGVLLFMLLWLYGRKPRKVGQVSGAFLFGYGTFRFIAEYFRDPDACARLAGDEHARCLDMLAWGMSRGQWLCVPMILGGIALWVWTSRRRT